METCNHNSLAEAIARYLRKGCSHNRARRVGFELEQFVVDPATYAPVTYAGDPVTGAPGVGEILRRLAPHYDFQNIERRNDGEANLIALMRDKMSITLEPGAQLEISVGPADTLAELEELHRSFRQELDPILDEFGYALVCRGYHPSACAHEVPLIPKDRYTYMDSYFGETGHTGICMMRASAATQTSVDFSDEDDAVRKYRIAHALGPFFSFITDNTPVYEGVDIKAAYRAASLADADGAVRSPRSGRVIPPRMARMANWDDCDPKRCLTPRVTFEEEFGLLSYAEEMLAAPAIFTYDDTPLHQTVYQGHTPFCDVYAGRDLDEGTIEHILSLFFYDVRLKHYVEIRQADSMPIDYALAFTALCMGLFYNEEAVVHYTERFARVDAAAVAAAKSALRHDGYDAVVYGRPAAEQLDELVAFAVAGLTEKEKPYLEPLAALVRQRTTLFDLA
ncbi:MAG: hypothetical protein LBD25_06350 [Coriobacteriales bacterium]|jgi:glutamate--cysteine ligase|nr:hypothetical protein [Coriobacteriales bacterium]